jgi:GNAT superfamily N-acetyltransferase
LEITIPKRPRPQNAKAIVRAIDNFNIRVTGDYDLTAVAIYLRQGRRRRGGLLGYTWGGWLTITYLWIDAPLRGRDFGMRLMRKAESEARRLRCPRIMVATHSFQARPFYEKLGFHVTATLADYPVGHAQYYLMKRLRAARQRKAK